jgi:hypothetical protein
MTAALIACASVWTYIAVGLFTARAVYRGDAYMMAFAFGFFWPALGTFWFVGRWFDATAPESVEETRARMRELERENSRLEKELGIGK